MVLPTVPGAGALCVYQSLEDSKDFFCRIDVALSDLIGVVMQAGVCLLKASVLS